MSDARCKTLRIKTGVVRRLAKEVSMYEKEVEQNKTKIDKMKTEGTDEYVVRKQEEVLQESMMMVPDCQKRLIVSFDELKTLVETEKDLSEADEYQQATAILAQVKEQLPR